MKLRIAQLSIALVLSNFAISQNTFPTSTGSDVGIGTTNPATRLSVIKDGYSGYGSGLFADNTVTLSLLSSSLNSGIRYVGGYYGSSGSVFLDLAGTNAGNHNSVNGFRISNDMESGGATSHLSFSGLSWNGSTTWTPVEHMRINNDGTVGIGTNVTNYSSAYKLLVDGKIGAKRNKVTLSTNPWPDYVFDKKYALKSLYTVEQFIKKYNHLPGMPSAAEVSIDGGVELGSMNTKLLEKIEELTLYMIELKKENDQLKKDNIKIKAVLRIKS